MSEQPESTGAMFLGLIDDLLRQPRLAEGVAWVRREFVPGDTLTTEGTSGQSLFVIRRGRVAVLGRAQLPGQPSVEVTVAELTEGNVFGESSLIDAYRSIATVRALTEGCAIEINGAMLAVYLDDRPQVGYLFFKYLLAVALDNLARTNQGVVELATIGLKLHGVPMSGV